MKDRLDRLVFVGDVISISSYDHGSTLRVMGIDKNVIFVKKCYRGRKIFPIRFLNVCRCDFRIVNR